MHIFMHDRFTVNGDRKRVDDTEDRWVEIKCNIAWWEAQSLEISSVVLTTSFSDYITQYEFDQVVIYYYTWGYWAG